MRHPTCWQPRLCNLLAEGEHADMTRQLMETMGTRGGACELEHRIRRADGSWDIAQSVATAIWDNNDAPSLMVHVRPITEHRRAALALQDSEMRFRTLADSGSALVWTSDAAGQCDYVNRPWTIFTGLSLEQSAGRWVAADHSPGQHPDLQGSLPAGQRTAYPVHPVNSACAVADGSYAWMQCAASPALYQPG